MPTRDNQESSMRCYTPSARLVAYLAEKVTIEKQKIQGKAREPQFTKIKRNNDRKKVDILNKIVFPSMANIVFFLEKIKGNPELESVFEEDIQELLLGSKNEGEIVFRRLLNSILNWNSNPPSLLNFRAQFFHTVLQAVYYRVPSIMRTELPLQVIRTNMVQDLGRAWAWTQILRNKVPPFDNSEATRKVEF